MPGFPASGDARRPGTYAIIVRCMDEEKIAVGRLGDCRFESGYHVYVGSAFGSGGVRARVMRHRRNQKALHWHIDYLTSRMPVTGAWYSHDLEPREHLWARVMSGLSSSQCLKGFGSSDCDCFSHLFHFLAQPRMPVFREALMRAAPEHRRLDVWNAT